jgi:hypothetical protein
MNFNLVYHIKKLIYRNSQLIRDNRTPIKKFLNKYILYGGGNDLIIEYEGNPYTYTQINDEYYYILYSKDEFDCVSIIIDKENKVGEIHGIGNYKSCLADTNVNIGSKLLKITIELFKQNKNYFEINKIILTDNSIKQCGKENIKLAHMLILLTGNTWYGKYGFRPINNNNYEYNKILNEKYNNNQLIIDNITIKQANILYYIKMTNDATIIFASQKIFETNENLLLKDFLKKFLRNYDNTCYFFSLFYEQLYSDLGLENFHRLLFGLDI